MGIFDYFNKNKKERDCQEQEKVQFEDTSFKIIDFDGKTYEIDGVKAKENYPLFQMALEAYEQNDYSTALNYFTELIDRDPANSNYFKCRGTVYEDMGNDLLAQIDFEKSIELDSNNSDSLYRLAMVYHRKGNLDRAIYYLTKAYNVFSKYDDVLGKAHSYSDNFLNGSYNTILGVHKRVIAFNLALFLIQTNNIEKGLPIIDELIEYCPTYSYPYYIKSLVYKQNGQYQKSLDLALKALKFGHPQAQALVNQLNVLIRQNKTSDDRYSVMVKNATFNPFNITCDPRFQNENKMPDYRAVFTRELKNSYNRLVSFNESNNQKALTSMVTGYTFNLVKSYYNNAGYVPKNTLDELLEQVYDAIQQTGFRALGWSLDDFKYNCYYGYLNE